MFEAKTANSASLTLAIKEMAVFFDLFDYPLTIFEVWGFLDRRLELVDLWALLDGHPSLGHQNGFYFLKGRESLVAERQKRHNYYQRKLKTAKAFARLFGAFPFVKAVFLANIIGSSNLRDGSDIDFFIITMPRRVWLSRLFCAGLAKFLNRRPKENDKRDKICLSFYISLDHLGLDSLKLPDGDPYFDYWIRGLVLLYNKDRVAERFWTANSPIFLTTIPPLVIRNNYILDKAEKAARRWQERIMPPVLKEAARESLVPRLSGVVLTDRIIKLYRRDRRQEIREKIFTYRYENSQ